MDDDDTLPGEEGKEENKAAMEFWQNVWKNANASKHSDAAEMKRTAENRLQDLRIAATRMKSPETQMKIVQELLTKREQALQEAFAQRAAIEEKIVQYQLQVQEAEERVKEVQELVDAKAKRREEDTKLIITEEQQAKIRMLAKSLSPE